MKSFAIFVLGVIFGAQAADVRHTLNNGVAAALGQYPWMVYIRTSTYDSGYLRSCTGSLIHERWILTVCSCLDNARFTWTRYGLVNTLYPERVTESATYRFHPSWNQVTGENNIALLGAGRNVDFTDRINPITIAPTTVLPATSGSFCGFGAIEWGSGAFVQVQPGYDLRCITVTVEDNNNEVIAYSALGRASRYDLGAPLVINNQLIGVMTEVPTVISGRAAVFTKAASFIPWINEQAGINL